MSMSDSQLEFGPMNQTSWILSPTQIIRQSTEIKIYLDYPLKYKRVEIGCWPLKSKTLNLEFTAFYPFFVSCQELVN